MGHHEAAREGEPAFMPVTRSLFFFFFFLPVGWFETLGHSWVTFAPETSLFVSWHNERTVSVEKHTA